MCVVNLRFCEANGGIPSLEKGGLEAPNLRSNFGLGRKGEFMQRAQRKMFPPDQVRGKHKQKAKKNREP